MALKSATTTLTTIQMRRGLEEDFDPDQMTAGEWAVSTNKKYVRMCFMPGLCLRMATYEAFEKDMEEIRQILVEAQDIHAAIERWNYLAESYAHGGTGKREGEDTDNAKYYSEQAKKSADKAESLSDIGIMTTEKAGIGKPDGTTITVDEDGTMHSVGGGEEGDFASKEIYGDDGINLGRMEGYSSGTRSISFGADLLATNQGSVAIGYKNQSTGVRSVTFGVENKSTGANSFVSGSYNNARGNNSVSFGNNNVSTDSHSFSEGCGNIAIGYGSHAENCQNIAGAKYVFKIASYDATNKKFTFDDTYTGFTDAFLSLEVGSELFVQNINYINDADIYTVSTKGSDGKSVTVNESIPTSNYAVLFATIIKSGGNYGGCHSEGRKNISLNNYAHSEGYMTEARGYCSHTEGNATRATANQAHAEGYNTQATGEQSHAEGHSTKALENYAHAEGIGTEAGYEAHAEGYFCVANGSRSHAGGYQSKAFGENSFCHGSGSTAAKKGSVAFGNKVNSSGENSFACGSETTASGNHSFCEGGNGIASGIYSHVEGYLGEASGVSSHAEGASTDASEPYSHAEGFNTRAEGQYAHAEGYSTIAHGSCAHAEGRTTIAFAESHAQGHYNDTSKGSEASSSGTIGTAFVIGNGTSSARSNAVRIDYNGKLWCKQAYSSTGADYAELFEWADGNIDNEDRRGYFVTIDGKKIRKAESGDYILGIISGNPSVIGNTDMEWYGQFMRDEFGTFIKETYKETVKEPSVDEDGNVTEEEREVDVEFYRVNPDYDPDAPYTFRLDRPEWDAVGMLGVLPVCDDGTCEVGKFCRCAGGGIATLAEERGLDTYMVIERVNENIVSVVLK